MAVLRLCGITTRQMPNFFVASQRQITQFSAPTGYELCEAAYNSSKVYYLRL
jgi:hypothetical protein